MTVKRVSRWVVRLWNFLTKPLGRLRKSWPKIEVSFRPGRNPFGEVTQNVQRMVKEIEFDQRENYVTATLPQ